MSSAKAKRAGILLALLIGVPATAYVAYALTLSRSPFDGETHHDFGVVPVTGEKTTVAHTYELVNRTGGTLIILDVVPSCGCAAADVSSYMIDPGDTATIRAHLTLSRSGLKEEAIGLVLKNRGARLVTMRAVGRRDPPIEPLQGQVRLDERGAGILAFTAERWEGDASAEPSIAVTEGLTARLSLWEQTQPADVEKHRPALWQGQVEVSAARMPPPEGATLSITTGEGSPVTVPVTSR